MTRGDMMGLILQISETISIDDFALEDITFKSNVAFYVVIITVGQY